MRSSTVPSAIRWCTFTVRVLADPVCAVGGLVLDGGVPGPVEVDHVAGPGQVQPGSGRADRRDEGDAVAGLEPVDDLLPLRGRGAAVQEFGGHASREQVGLDQVPHRHVSGEDQRCVPGGGHRVHQLLQRLKLAGPGGLDVGVPAVRGLPQEMRGRVADLPQRLEQAEHLAPAGDAGAGFDPRQRVGGRGLVQRGLLPGQLHEAVTDHLVRQLGRDAGVGLAAAQEEWCDEPAQPPSRVAVRLPLGRPAVALTEGGEGSEQPGIRPIQDGP